jgi:DNA-binding response OmpR family regulator
LRSSGYRGRIIAMSGGGESSPGVLLSRALDMGADECVPKPFHRADLLAKVNSLLNAERRAEPP